MASHLVNENVCDRCGRVVVDGSTDFGGGLTLRPTCQGIRAEVRGELVQFLAVDELRDFLRRAYGG